MKRRETIENNVENSAKGEDRKEGNPAKIKELLKRMARPITEGIVVAAAAAVLSTGCTTEFNTNRDSTEEVDGTEDGMEADHVDEHDIPEMEDVPDADLEDVGPGDVTGEDLTEEEPVACEPMDAELVTFIDVDTSVAVGNIEVEYGGLGTGGEGIYRILCEGSVVDTLNIPEGEDGFSSLPGRGNAQIHVNTARAWGSNVVITVSAL